MTPSGRSQETASCVFAQGTLGQAPILLGAAVMKTMTSTRIGLLLLLTACAPATRTPSPVEAPSFAGFDTWRYPGDDLMRLWRSESPYRWVGYYLPAPCHRDDSFSGRREFLESLGWGTAVIYVGQQLFEGVPQAEITETPACSSRLLTADQGIREGRDAIEKTRAEGFPPGSVIFLDIERVERIPPELLAYYENWVRTVLEDGSYRPGTYVHRSNAAALYSVAQSILHHRGIEESVPFWIAGGGGFTVASSPNGTGYGFASVWQGVLDVERSFAGRSIIVDENVARHPSPSAPNAN